MYYTIYKITNKINGKCYIGKHRTEIPEDQYMGSGVAIKRAIKKYGKENFQKEILFILESEEEMNEKERELVTIGDHSYNMAPGGKGGFGYINANDLNRGDNNVMRKNPEAKRKCREKWMRTRNSNKEYYDEISRKNIAKAIEKQTGVKRPEHAKIMKEKTSFHKLWENKEEFRDKISSWFEVTSPSGEMYKTNRLEDFCKCNNITYVAVWNTTRTGFPVSKGKAKGWICRKI